MMTKLASTEDAIEYGLHIRHDSARVAHLLVLHDRAEARALALLKHDLDGAMRYAVKSQFYREAYEAATMTGGIGDLLHLKS